MYNKHRCEDHDNGHHVGKFYCRNTCDYCHYDWDDDDSSSSSSASSSSSSTSSDSDDSCSDDERYRYYGDYWKVSTMVCSGLHFMIKIFLNPHIVPNSFDSSLKDCHWIYKYNRCDRVLKNGKKVGIEYCPHSCGHCDDDDYKSKKPTKRPTKRPTRNPSSPTHKPTSKCHSTVDINRYCYDGDDHRPEVIRVHFENCHPEKEDWIGIYKSYKGDLGQTREWWGNSFLWKYACGSISCEHAESSGTIRFREWWDDLEDGEYKAYLFEDDSYHVKASSDEFEVGDCGHRKPTKKPTSHPTPSHPTPTKKPTKKPTSYCHNSVEVEQYCYKDHYPSKLEVFFENCHPESKDWIGIYEVQHGKLGQTRAWWGNSYLWMFTCGSRKCDHPEDYGTLYFGEWWSVLMDGQYRAYLFEDDSFHVKASSETFKVGHCYN